MGGSMKQMGKVRFKMSSAALIGLGCNSTG
jgi:hypothetical protein